MNDCVHSNSKEIVGKGAYIMLKPSVVFHTYPSFILDVFISSFVNKGFHCDLMTFLSCNVQGSSLIKKKIAESSEHVLKTLSDTYPPQVLFTHNFLAVPKTLELIIEQIILVM